MKKLILVLTTVPKKEKGREIAQKLVQERLAACVTVCPAARSLYQWKGRIIDDREYLLLIKTKAILYPKLEKRIQELHPYQVPEILALPILKCSVDYLRWVEDETQG